MSLPEVALIGTLPGKPPMGLFFLCLYSLSIWTGMFSTQCLSAQVIQQVVTCQRAVELVCELTFSQTQANSLQGSYAIGREWMNEWCEREAKTVKLFPNSWGNTGTVMLQSIYHKHVPFIVSPPVPLGLVTQWAAIHRDMDFVKTVRLIILIANLGFLKPVLFYFIPAVLILCSADSQLGVN